MAKKRLSKKRKLEAIAGSGGLINDIAARAGVHRTTVRAWKKSDADIAAAIEEERECTVDKAERVVINAVEAGDLNAAKYILSTLGRHRGYTTRSEVEAEVRAVGTVQIFIPDNNRDPLPDSSAKNLTD